MVRTKLTPGTTFTEISGFLANLELYKEYNIQDLVNTILQITNLKFKTLDGILPAIPYDSQTETELLEDLWVCMTYQRKIRLRKIVDKILAQGGFDKDAAGHIDIAVRPKNIGGRKVVWDGFRRCLKAGICGLDRICYSKTQHPMNFSLKECIEKEAKLYKIRNAEMEKLKPEEIFKSEIAYKDPIALETLELMKDCELSVEGLNPNGIELGAIVIFRKHFNNIAPDKFITSSSILRKAFFSDTVITGYLFVSLANLLDLNVKVDSSWDEEDILESFKNWIKIQDNCKQSNITRDGFRNTDVITYLIASRILNDTDGLLEKCKENLNKIQLETIEELSA